MPHFYYLQCFTVLWAYAWNKGAGPAGDWRFGGW